MSGNLTNSSLASRSLWVVLGLVALAAAGCPDAIFLEDPDFETNRDTGSDVEPDGSGEGSGQLPPADLEDPTVEITSPNDGSSVEATTVVIEGTANDDSGIASVWVQVGPNAPVLVDTQTSYRTWSIEVDAPVGTFPVEAVAYDADYQVAGPPDSILLNRTSAQPDSGAPTVTIDSPEDGSAPLFATVLIRGSAFDDRAVVRMETYLNGELRTERSVETDDFFANWNRLIALVPGELNTIEIIAYDAMGNSGSASIDLTGRSRVDEDPPEVEILSHSDGDTIDTGTLALEGTAFDRAGIRELKVRVGTPTDNSTIWSDYVFATTTDGYTSWNVDLDVDPGEQVVEARAIDVNGLATSEVITLFNDFVPEWSEEETFFLRLRENEGPNLIRMELDRQGVSEVINEDIQQAITLLELDPVPLLTNTLNEIKYACGSDWERNNSNPNHDCSLTELGRTFRGSDGTWQTSSEYSMVRLLTMTPANVEVEGTSIAGLRGMADFLGIGGGFSAILSDSLGIGMTDEIVSTEAAVDALRTNVLGSHPNTTDEGRIPFTMYDAMQDLAPLAENFGPAGDHPGILDPAVPPSGQVLDDDFVMIIDAESNLRWLDGIDLSDGKDYMATVVDTVGPTFNDVVEFDFTDPSRFTIEGLVQNPVVDLRFQILENDSFIDSCNDDNACQANLPGSPLNGSSVWAQPEWQIETILAQASYNQYGGRTFYNCYLNIIFCQASVGIGQDGNPAGWSQFEVLFNLGNPPKDQYIWELIGEVAQVSLHRLPSTTLPEGDADVAFTLQDLPVGITADEIREGVRPYLQDQASELSELLLGDYSGNNGTVDFFYRRGADGVPYLFFVAEEDPRPVDGYNYRAPGFYSSPDLSPESKVSFIPVAGSGDTTHEKLRIVNGETTVYAEDDEGQVFRLRIEVQDNNFEEITVRVSRRMR